VNIGMYSEIMVEQIWRCTWKPSLCKLGVRNGVSLEMHLQAVIERIWRYTWRPRSTELRDALRGLDQAGLDMHLEAKIE